MATIKNLYGSSNQSITCTITSLGNGSYRQSTAVDNSSNLFIEVLVFVKCKTAASSTSSTGTVSVYAYGTVDGGTTYTDGATGSDGSITPTNPPNLKLIGIINTVANSVTYYGGPFAISPAFGGTLPDHWGVVILNSSGNTLDASIGSVYYQGIQAQSV